MTTNIFVAIIDWIASMFISAFHIVRGLGLSLFEYFLILLAVILAFRWLSVLLGRLRLAAKLKKALRAKGVEQQKKHSLFRSVFYRFKPYPEEDFSFTVGERTYHIKFFPGIVKGWRVVFDEDRLVLLTRFFLRKKFSLLPIRPDGQAPQAIGRDPLHKPADDDPQNEYVLLFAPAPRGFYEAVRMRGGYDRFPLEGGNRYLEFVFCDADLFLRQLDRILDGYVDSFLFENQKNEEE